MLCACRIVWKSINLNATASDVAWNVGKRKSNIKFPEAGALCYNVYQLQHVLKETLLRIRVFLGVFL